ncbi:hypothetical protein KK062_24535 [Fulvivirgaceae bacterium PWU5]|uniref:Uncharacterized protein n=1 Tax=Dawidia cretensis TaxID=2782350 RepID=A0AAP2GVV8_9BACT|nr:hypothetical protein [Dawidia cretensis]MBT1711433.1 hypothetical protein [Dawidia cretensis]
MSSKYPRGRRRHADTRPQQHIHNANQKRDLRLSSLQEKVHGVLNDKFGDVLKLVVLGFISFDFFHPLTFKFIAELFKDANDRANLFVTFKICYLTLPLLLYVVYLYASNKIQLPRNILKGGLRIRPPKSKPIQIVILLFILVIVCIDVCVPSQFQRYPFVITIVALWMLLLLVHFTDQPTVASQDGDSSRSPFVQRVMITLRAVAGAKGLSFVTLCMAVVFACGLYAMHALPKPEKPAKDQKAPSKRSGEVAMTVKASNTIALPAKNISTKDSVKIDSSPYWRLYLKPFALQNSLKEDEKHYTTLKETDQLIHQGALRTEYLLNIAIADSVSRGVNPFENFNTQNLQEITPAVVASLKHEFSDTTRRIHRLRVIGQQFLATRSYTSYYRANLELTISKRQKESIDAASNLLKHVQKIDLLTMFSITFALLVLYQATPQLQNAGLKSLILLYFLMFLQGLKPVDPNHINLSDPAWPYTYANWYIPGYISEIGSIGSIDNSRTVYGSDNIDNSTRTTETVYGDDGDLVIGGPGDIYVTTIHEIEANLQILLMRTDSINRRTHKMYNMNYQTPPL